MWRTSTNRPPLEESHVTCTVLSMHGLDRYAAPDQRPDAAAALARAREWLADAPTPNLEDKALRLWALHRFGAEQKEIEQARATLRNAQRDDGGWAQNDRMASDAYATGQALYALTASGVPPTDPAVTRGLLDRDDTLPADPGLLRQRRPPRQEPVHLGPRDQLGRRRAESRPPHAVH
jgi:hypothetical protein